jgi:recombination protein RecA
MSQALRKLTAPIGRSGTAGIFINQLREKVALYSEPEVTPATRLEILQFCQDRLKTVETIKQGNAATGTHV